MAMGRPPKKPEDLRQYQRIGILKSTYQRALYNAHKRDITLLEYFDKVVKREKGYEEEPK